MPAIQPAKLRTQAARLAELFDQPAVLVRAMHGMLGLYADRTYRPGQSGDPPTLLAAYRVPPQVLRQLFIELKPRAAQETYATLALCQALWNEAYYEHRFLAASLLGQAPVTPPAPVLDHLETWLATSPEDRILTPLLDQGLARLRQEDPTTLLKYIRQWLDDKGLPWQQYALRALQGLAQEPSSDSLPSIFPLIIPLLRSAPLDLRPDLLSLLEAAARRSPQETAYVLRSNLVSLDNPNTSWLVRQVLDAFPPTQQDSLRAALRK